MSDRPLAKEGRRADGRDGSLSVSARCELLASARRRALVRHLAGRPGEAVRVRDLLDHLLAETPDQNRQNVLVSVRHVHLPKLAEHGVVTYDDARDLVRYERHDELERLLDFLDAE